jgi:anti-anti-sigma regulatory factor
MKPFVVTRQGETAVVRFARHVDHVRDESLVNLVSECSSIVWDFSDTETMETGWLRFLAVLHDDGMDQGKSVVTVAMSQSLRESADYLGLGPSFEASSGERH